MPDKISKNSERPKYPLPDLPSVTMRQLFLFNKIVESGSQLEIAERYDIPPSTLSKDIRDLRQQFNLSYLGDKDFWDGAEAKTLEKGFSKLLEVAEKCRKSAFPKVITIGSGGSLLAWWISRKISPIREACSKIDGAQMEFSDILLSCHPMTNRNILSDVYGGLLDFGLVRKSLLVHSRAANSKNSNVEARFLGEVKYGIAVPDRLKESWPEDGTDWATDAGGYLIHERNFLDRGYFASVGPEGEFGEQLSRALLDADISLKIEFSYRSFPQIIPHLLDGTHFGLCPFVEKWKTHIPNTTIYPLKLLSEYKREIMLIWNKSLKRPWIDIDRIADELTWH